jgi:hypothetical protein
MASLLEAEYFSCIGTEMGILKQIDAQRHWQLAFSGAF